MTTETATANPFRKAADEARSRGEYDLSRRIITEGRIAHRLVSTAIADGYFVSINDGEETVVQKSRDINEIIAAMFSTDEGYVIIYKGDWTGQTSEFKRFGRVYLVYGNDGNDVISDYSAPDLDAFSAWMKPVDDFAEEA